MNYPQWVVDAVRIEADALTLKAGLSCQVSGLRKNQPLLQPDT